MTPNATPIDAIDRAWEPLPTPNLRQCDPGPSNLYFEPVNAHESCSKNLIRRSARRFVIVTVSSRQTSF
jgi:hypothetical protein